MNGVGEGSHDHVMRPMRPQYHYFYGTCSTEEGSVSATASAAGLEQESLIGESLVPTDNEEEAPSSSRDFDLQHVLISNGNGVKHLRGANGPAKADKNQPWHCQLLGLQLLNLRENNPGGHVVGLVGCMMICMVTFAITIFPSTRGNTVGNGGIQGQAKFTMQFPVIDRAKSSDPVSAFVDKNLFHPNLLYRGSDPFREFTFPFPTGAFWTNLVLPPTADNGFSYPIVVYPYAYKWAEALLAVSYPALHRQQDDPKAIHDYFLPDLTLGTVEEVRQRRITAFDPLSVTLSFLTGGSKGASWQTFLVQGSPYVTIEYDNVTPVVKALSTFKAVVCPGEDTGGSGKDDEFEDSFDDDDNTGSRRRRLFGVCTASNDLNVNGVTILRGVQFVFQTQEGVNWIVFSSEPISFVFDTQRRTDIVSSKMFQGTLRLAIIPPSSSFKYGVTSSGSEMVQISSSTGLRRLVYHAAVYPVAARIDWDFRDPSPTTPSLLTPKKVVLGLTSPAATSAPPLNGKTLGSKIGTVHFLFTTKIANTNTNAAASATVKTTDLLMLALPHHVTAFSRIHALDMKHFDLVYRCIKGPLTPVLGSSWSYDEKLPSLGFDGNLANPSPMPFPNAVRDTLVENLEADLKIALPTHDGHIYGFGKQLARLAQLTHIASILAEADEGHRLQAVKQTATDSLRNYLNMLLSDQLADSLLYDATLGGLVSTDGLSDWNADFGNGRYNEHHFQYGYILYACAIMGKLDSSFLELYGERVDAIFHDIAYNSKIADGSFFPLARHMSWFDGHSFASGLFPSGNGKSQESSSEAVNCYYGAYLWSFVRSGINSGTSLEVSALTDFSRLLLAMEVRGARTYWHMMPPPTSNGTKNSGPAIYNPRFSKNLMVGNLGMLDAKCSNWLGTENIYVHMINFLPVTGITRELFDKEYVSEEYTNVISNYADVEMTWRGYAVCDHAIVAPAKAWEAALDLKSSLLDSGLSKSQVLYFILNSPGGFNTTGLHSSENSPDSDRADVSGGPS